MPEQGPLGTSRSDRRTTRHILGSGLVVAVFLGWVFLRPLGEFWAMVGGSLIVTGTALVAGATCLRTGLRCAGSERLGWYLLTGAMWSWTLGNCAWLWYMVTSPTGPPFPSVVDVLFVAFLPLALAGAVSLRGLERGGIRALLDGLVISGSLLFVSWVTVLGPMVRTALDVSVLGSVIALALPIGDIALASMCFILLARAGERRSTLALVGLGMLALAVADSGMAYMLQVGAYSSGFLANVGWIVGFLLIMHGALLFHARAGWSAEAARTHGPSESPLWLSLPYVPLAIAVTISVALYALRGGIGPFLYTLSIVLVLLVVARQLVALRDNVLLTRSLRRTLEDLRRREEDLQYLAFHDPLTGLANRTLFHKRSKDAVNHPFRRSTPAALYIDLDGFKQVNDRLGHAAGDSLLIAVAARLKTCVRPTDTVARLGGDEFAILLDGVEPDVEVTVVAERVVEMLCAGFVIDGEAVNIGASVGVACHEPNAGDDGDEMLRRADIAMYAAKMQGKRRYLMFEPIMGAAVAESSVG